MQALEVTVGQYLVKTPYLTHLYVYSWSYGSIDIINIQRYYMLWSYACIMIQYTVILKQSAAPLPGGMQVVYALLSLSMYSYLL